MSEKKRIKVVYSATIGNPYHGISKSSRRKHNMKKGKK